MRFFLILLALLSISYISVAQFPGGGRPGGAGGQQITGTMYGKIIDGISQKPIPYASIQLLGNKFDTVTKKMINNVVIGGMLTESNGDFRLEKVPVLGQLKLKVTVVGFKPYEQAVSFDIKKTESGAPDMSSIMNALDKDLGNITINIEEKMLENVVVTAEKTGLQLGIDRKVFNVDKNIVSAGGTAVDIMRNVPSLNVDIDGNVSLRNNSPQIFVDGRPTTMELDQIPADAIESVEIITNPSAKFDASGGTAGILNIILKKNRKVGYNGSVRASIDSRGRIGFGGDINIRQNKINAFASVNYNQRYSKSTGVTERLSTITNPNYSQLQNDISDFDGNFTFIRTGLDYFMTNRSTLSASLNIASGKFEPFSSNEVYTKILSATPYDSLTKRVTNSSREFNNKGASISFKHNFPKAGRELTADINYRERTGPNNNLLTTQIFNPDLTTVKSTQIQRQIGDGKSNNVTFQTDFINPLSDNSKMEMGVRAEFNDNTSTNGYYNVDPSTGQIIPTPTSYNDYKSNDRVLAAYATFSNRIKNFGYQLGLRAESSNYLGDLRTTNEKFNIDYPISLFPSVFLNQKLGGNQEIQLNYSRRINRPNFWQLIPFIDSSDILNPSVGNPALLPEFTNSLELSYQKTFKNKANFLTSIYYKNTNALISRFQEVRTIPGTSKEQLISTYINANSSYVTGLELTLRNNLAKWWELTSNVNLFTSKIDIDDVNIPKQDQFVSWFAKINNSFKVTKKLSFQLSGSYQSKTVLPPGGSGGGGGRGGYGGFGQSTSAQGYVKPVYYVDAAMRYSFMKEDRASLSLNISDIFKSRVSDVHSEAPGFIQDAIRRRDAQVLRLNFSWRFGKFDASLFKRKSNKQGDPNGGIDMGGLGQ
ncbi:MAG: outer membrane beta-barrel family protein [Chitinophagaceae bacterium]